MKIVIKPLIPFPIPNAPNISVQTGIRPFFRKHQANKFAHTSAINKKTSVSQLKNRCLLMKAIPLQFLFLQVSQKNWTHFDIKNHPTKHQKNNKNKQTKIHTHTHKKTKQNKNLISEDCLRRQNKMPSLIVLYAFFPNITEVNSYVLRRWLETAVFVCQFSA